jgi:hypothetical protein
LFDFNTSEILQSHNPRRFVLGGRTGDFLYFLSTFDRQFYTQALDEDLIFLAIMRQVYGLLQTCLK